VGLAQREIEKAGMATISLSNIPDLTASVSVPRMVGIEHPFGQIMGMPGDDERQRAVLSGALNAIEKMTVPGSALYLPYTYPDTILKAEISPQPEPPIATYLKRRPWHLPRLFTRKIPEHDPD